MAFSSRRSAIRAFVLVAALLSIDNNDNHDAMLFCHAQSTFSLCESSPDICTQHTGTYTDHDGISRKWWAFVPSGELSCPSDQGCPLYVWIDGTEQSPFQIEPDQHYMMEMLRRGYVAVNVEYHSFWMDYTSGCYGSFWDRFGGFDDKSREIFSGQVPDSVVAQLCDAPGTRIANCDLGIATHGWSQGAHIAALAHNHDKRVSASLLFGVGNDASIDLQPELSCMNTLALPRERRRSIVGENDRFFGEDYLGVLGQQIKTSGYDCRTAGLDGYDCFHRLPEGCSYDAAASSTHICEATGTIYSVTCDACNIEESAEEEGLPLPCPDMNPDLRTRGCPRTVPDPYLTDLYSEARIEDTAGYYIVPGAGHGFFNDDGDDPNLESKFLDPDTVWGLKQNLDWLARIARRTPASYAAASLSSSSSSSASAALQASREEPSGRPSLRPSLRAP